MTDWLALAKGAYDTSTSYVDNNYRKRWEDNLRMFQSKHPSDSKYGSEAYKHRSKLFRPKTRSVVRKNEAAAAAAFFSNVDVVSVTAEEQGNQQQVASAAINKELLNYRLQKTIPWFQTLIGGLQDAQVMGAVCSYQYWKFRQDITVKYAPQQDEFGQMVVDFDGQPVMQEVKVRKIKEDKPCIELIPLENLRIDPGASWIDPINTSPYVIWLIPMYVCDIRAMMDSPDEKTGQPKWKAADEKTIRAATEQNHDSTRQAREGKREDSKGADKPVTDFEIVWVHLNIIRHGGDDYVFYTLGTEHLLSAPKPLVDVYFHSERPFVMGTAVIESHKLMPSALTELGEGLQREANEIVNQRLDNVKLVLNKRWKVKRGQNVDIQSLMRNVAGSVTLVDELEDVNEISWPDITSSSYQEQDRINVDYDELVGNFSTGSVQSNRELNDTVGGMNLIARGADALTEYLIRTFTVTWVEPVLRQLVKLEQKYETDKVILALAADKAQAYQKYGIDEVTDELLNQELTLSVNVGMGATDPVQRMNKLMSGTSAIAKLSQIPGLNQKEIRAEIWGYLGYQDGKRFTEEEKNPEVEQLTQQVQQLDAVIQKMTAELENKKQSEQNDLEIAEDQIASREIVESNKLQIEYEKLDLARDKMIMDNFAARLSQARK